MTQEHVSQEDQTANTDASSEVGDENRFSGRAYAQRTRRVLAEQFKEATKVQADTRAALLEVWRDFRADLNQQWCDLSDSAKRRTASIRSRFVGGAGSAEMAAKKSETPPTA